MASASSTRRRLSAGSSAIVVPSLWLSTSAVSSDMSESLPSVCLVGGICSDGFDTVGGTWCMATCGCDMFDICAIRCGCDSRHSASVSLREPSNASVSVAPSMVLTSMVLTSMV